MNRVRKLTEDRIVSDASNAIDEQLVPGFFLYNIGHLIGLYPTDHFFKIGKTELWTEVDDSVRDIFNEERFGKNR